MHILYRSDQSVRLLQYVLIRTNTVIRFIRLGRFCSDTCLQLNMFLLPSVDSLGPVVNIIIFPNIILMYFLFYIYCYYIMMSAL